MDPQESGRLHYELHMRRTEAADWLELLSCGYPSGWEREETRTEFDIV